LGSKLSVTFIYLVYCLGGEPRGGLLPRWNGKSKAARGEREGERERGRAMTLDQVDTIQDLKAWLRENMPGATLKEGEGGITISTGLESTMGGYLYPIEREGE
jgi:hypothetical protein